MGLLKRFSTPKGCRLLADGSSRVAQKYKRFKEFLDHNHDGLRGL
jgi:hypothetical protein